MNGIWVALSSKVTEEQVAAFLAECFPDVDSMAEEAAMQHSEEWPPVVFSLDEIAAPDFPCYLSFACFPGPEQDGVAVGAALAQRLSDALACRTLCDGSGWGDDESPYWSILWEDARPYLADDAGTDFADGGGGPVRVVRELVLPEWSLDSSGRLV